MATTPRTPARKKIPPPQTRGDAPKAPARARAAKKAALKPPVKAVAKKATTTKRAPAKKVTPAKRTARPRSPKPPVTKPNVRQPGAVELKVRADIEALVSGHPMGEALAAMSYALARGIDEGPEMMRAALNRELRLNLAELAGMSVGGDDLGAELSIPEGGETG